MHPQDSDLYIEDLPANYKFDPDKFYWIKDVSQISKYYDMGVKLAYGYKDSDEDVEYDKLFMINLHDASTCHYNLDDFANIYNIITSDANIEDVSPLSHMKYIELEMEEVLDDISPLKNVDTLIITFLQGNADLSVLTNVRCLHIIGCDDNLPRDLSCFANCEELRIETDGIELDDTPVKHVPRLTIQSELTSIY